MIRVAEIFLIAIAIAVLAASAFGSISMNWHRWRKPGVLQPMFMVFVCFGFFTVGYSRTLIQDELQLLRQALKRLRGGSE